MNGSSPIKMAEAELEIYCPHCKEKFPWNKWMPCFEQDYPDGTGHMEATCPHCKTEYRCGAY